MALKSTIYKVSIQIADIERSYYQTHDFTLACHPSETLSRMLLRVLVYALHAEEGLQFTKGLSTDDEPDIWKKSLTGELKMWIDLGQPDEKRIRKACGRAEQVIIYGYQPRSIKAWWQQIGKKLTRFNNLSIYQVSETSFQALEELAERSMQLSCTIDQGDIWLSNGKANIKVERTQIFPQ